MSEISLDVRLDGFSEAIGELSRNQNGALNFRYKKIYANQANALPLSLSIPVTDEPYDDILTRAFFDNLLQEREGPLQRVMAREGISRDDIAGLLFYLGKDCAGAISVLPQGSPAVKVPGDYDQDYNVVTENVITRIVKSLSEKNTFPIDTDDPSPLAGVQNKFAMTFLPNGQLAWPKSGLGAPTTHIIKVPNRNNPNDANLEAATLELSTLTGQETVEAETRVFDGTEVLIIKRFDRRLDENGQIVRIHQEDFAQAIGLPRALKYERDGKAGRRFDVHAIRKIIDQTATTMAARMDFIYATIFDLLVGNVDAHAKNHALLYEGGGRPIFAPRYDLVPTRLDSSLTDELPYKIGNASRIDEIEANDFDMFLKNIGIATPSARQRIARDAVHQTANILAPELETIARKGMRLYADLIAANMRLLLPAFGVPVPESAQDRDAFIQRGGGRLLS